MRRPMAMSPRIPAPLEPAAVATSGQWLPAREPSIQKTTERVVVGSFASMMMRLVRAEKKKFTAIPAKITRVLVSRPAPLARAMTRTSETRDPMKAPAPTPRWTGLAAIRSPKTMTAAAPVEAPAEMPRM